MTMLAHVILSANAALEKRRLFSYAKKHNLTWALEDTYSNAIDTGYFTCKGRTYSSIGQYSKLDRDDQALEGYTTKVMDEFDNRVSVANAAHRLRDRLLRLEYKMDRVTFPYIGLDIDYGRWGFELGRANIFSSDESKPYAFEAMLARGVFTYAISEPVFAVVYVFGGVGQVCGKIAEKRRAKKAKKEQAQKAAEAKAAQAQKEAEEKAAQVKAERELVQAKNIEIDQIDKFMDIVKSAKSMSVLTRSVDSRDKSAIVLGLVDAKNGQVCEFVTKDGDKVVVFNYRASAENDQVSAFLKTQAGNFQELATVKSELGMKEVKAEINTLPRRLVKPTNEQRQEMWHQIIQAHANDKVVG